VLIDVEHYEQLTKDQQTAKAQCPARSFLDRVSELEERFGGDADGFTPPKTNYRPQNPFSSRTR
jgi:hypothetical protein